MEFTSKQKITAYVIAGILAFGFIASTVSSIIMSFHLQPEVVAEVQNGRKKVETEATAATAGEPKLDIDPTDTESAEALLSSESSVDGYIEFNTGFIEAAKANGSLAYEPPQVAESEVAASGSEDKAEVTCSSSFRVSIDGYREGLIKQENERWAKVSKEARSESEAEKRTKAPSVAQSESQVKPSFKELEVEHKSRLDSIETVHQHHLKINKCE